MIVLRICVVIYVNKCIGMCQLFFFGFYMWGRVPGWQLFFGGSGCSDVETPRFSVIRSHTKVSLGLKHFVLEGVM